MQLTPAQHRQFSRWTSWHAARHRTWKLKNPRLRNCSSVRAVHLLMICSYNTDTLGPGSYCKLHLHDPVNLQCHYSCRCSATTLQLRMLAEV